MEPRTGGLITILFASVTPLLLLAVITIRFIRIRRRRAGAAIAKNRGSGAHGSKREGSSGTLSLRRSDRAITDPERIESILRAATICRLGLSVRDEPYVVPLSYGLADPVAGSVSSGPAPGLHCVLPGNALRVYFHGASAGQKMDLIRSNSRACFEVEGQVGLAPADESCSWTVLYESVIGFGRVTVVTDDQEKQAGLRCILLHHGVDGTADMPDGAINGTAVFRLDLETLTGKSNWPEGGYPAT